MDLKSKKNCSKWGFYFWVPFLGPFSFENWLGQFWGDFLKAFFGTQNCSENGPQKSERPKCSLRTFYLQNACPNRPNLCYRLNCFSGLLFGFLTPKITKNTPKQLKSQITNANNQKMQIGGAIFAMFAIISLLKMGPKMDHAPWTPKKMQKYHIWTIFIPKKNYP